MRNRYIYHADTPNTHIYQVHTSDGIVRLFDESSRISELANLEDIKSVQTIPIGQSFREKTSPVFIGISAIAATIIVVLISSTLFPFKISSALEASNASPSTSVINNCQGLVDTLEREKCSQGFVEHKLIERYEIPLNAKRVKIESLPSVVCFKHGDRLLIVKDTLK